MALKTLSTKPAHGYLYGSSEALGADAINVDVNYDKDGNIIIEEERDSKGNLIAPFSSKNLGKVLVEMQAPATSSKLGIIKIGEGLSITEEGTLSTKVYEGASASANGEMGSVPAALKGQQDFFLRGDGQWIENKPYGIADSTQDGIISSASAIKLDVVLNGGSNEHQHLIWSASGPVWGDYLTVSSSNDGMMSKEDKIKLDGINLKATESEQGAVSIGDNITVNDGKISLTGENIAAALGYSPMNITAYLPNSVDADGYVPIPPKGKQYVWKTNSSGSPAWREEKIYNVFNPSNNMNTGLVPILTKEESDANGNNLFLRGDATWAPVTIPVNPNDTTGLTVWISTN